MTNPYQSPSVGGDVFAEIEPEECWRDGKQLVVTERTILPGRCPKCNKPAQRSRTIKLRVVRPVSMMRVLAFVAIFGGTMATTVFLAALFTRISVLVGIVVGFAVIIGYWGWDRYRDAARPKTHLNFVRVEFSLCGRHRNTEWARFAISFVPLMLIFASTFLENAGVKVPSVSAFYFPWIIAMIISARYCFQPVAKRQFGSQFWVDGCCEEFLADLSRYEPAAAEVTPESPDVAT